MAIKRNGEVVENKVEKFRKSKVPVIQAEFEPKKVTKEELEVAAQLKEQIAGMDLGKGDSKTVVSTVEIVKDQVKTAIRESLNKFVGSEFNEETLKEMEKVVETEKVITPEVKRTLEQMSEVITNSVETTAETSPEIWNDLAKLPNETFLSKLNEKVSNFLNLESDVLKTTDAGKAAWDAKFAELREESDRQEAQTKKQNNIKLLTDKIAIRSYMQMIIASGVKHIPKEKANALHAKLVKLDEEIVAGIINLL